MNFERIPSIPDGNCLFRSVEQYLLRKNIFKDFHFLQNQAVKYVQENWDNLSSFKSVVSMSKNGRNATECLALSEIYQINFKICVYQILNLPKSLYL